MFYCVIVRESRVNKFYCLCVGSAPRVSSGRSEAGRGRVGVWMCAQSGCGGVAQGARGPDCVRGAHPRGARRSPPTPVAYWGPEVSILCPSCSGIRDSRVGTPLTGVGRRYDWGCLGSRPPLPGKFCAGSTAGVSPRVVLDVLGVRQAGGCRSTEWSPADRGGGAAAASPPPHARPRPPPPAGRLPPRRQARDSGTLPLTQPAPARIERGRRRGPWGSTAAATPPTPATRPPPPPVKVSDSPRLVPVPLGTAPPPLRGIGPVLLARRCAHRMGVGRV